MSDENEAPTFPPSRGGRRHLKSLPAGPEAATTLRDGAYLRVSAIMGREDDRFMSPELQLKAINAARMAAGSPSEIVHVWKDLDVSGRSMDRPELNDALQWAKDNRIDRLWVYDLSRWARCAVEGMQELGAIERLGCKVMSTTENVDLNSPEGYFSATVFLALHEMYSRRIGQQWARVHKHRVENGEWHGPPPIGYYREPHPSGKKTKLGNPVTAGPLLVDPEWGPRVTLLFRRYKAGVGIRVLRDEFSVGRRVPARYSTIKDIIDNPAYAGYVHINGRTYRGNHKALIDEETWLECQERHKRDSWTPSRSLATAHALKSLLFCAHCGGFVAHNGAANKGPRYHCERAAQYRTCPNKGIGTPLVEKVEQAVLLKVEEHIGLLRTNAVELAERKSKQTRATIDAERLGHELSELQAARDRIADQLARGRIDEDRHDRLDAEYEAEERTLTRQLDDVRRVLDVPTPDIVVDRMTQLLTLWKDMTPEERNRALRPVIKQVLIRRAHYRLEPEANRIRVEFL